MSSRSSLVRVPRGLEDAATIRASRTATFTVTSNGCGVESRTMSTSRALRSSSRSSEIALVITDLPRRESMPKAISSS